VTPIRIGESPFVGLRDSASTRQNQHLFRDLDVLRNAEGMKAVISLRLSNGVITFIIIREFERDGETSTTGFVPASQIDAYIEFVLLVKKRIVELAADIDLASRK
jgi:hypothetical protein